MPCVRCDQNTWIPVVFGASSPEMARGEEKRHYVYRGDDFDHAVGRRACKTCLLIEGAELDWTPIEGPRGDPHWWRPLDSSLTGPALRGYNTNGAWDSLALSFDGYAAFGGDRCVALGQKIRRGWQAKAQLRSNVALLRCALFAEQRKAHHTGVWGDVPFVEAVIARLHEEATSLDIPKGAPVALPAKRRPCPFCKTTIVLDPDEELPFHKDSAAAMTCPSAPGQITPELFEQP